MPRTARANSKSHEQNEGHARAHARREKMEMMVV